MTICCPLFRLPAMNLEKKRDELIDLLEKFLTSPMTEHRKIYGFAWAVIEDWSKIKNPPEPEEFENVFWAAIWTIQHLCDEEHIRDGITLKEVRPYLNWLKGVERPPADVVGKRP